MSVNEVNVPPTLSLPEPQTRDGPVDQDYELEVSGDLVTWETLLQFRLNTSPFTFTDVDSDALGIRFYRWKLVQQA